MNDKDYLNSNDSDSNISHQRTWVRVENILSTLGNIVYCPCRCTSATILKLENNNNITIKCHAQGYPVYRIDVDSLLIEPFSPYQLNG